MMLSLGCLFLLVGAGLSLFAAVGLLRLPDFFMRMHAATKAGVAGCGLVLIGVALADATPSTWTKVALAILFLVLTTPVAGHLLGRAAYVSGAPFWPGTSGDALRGVLSRGHFGPAGTLTGSSVRNDETIRTDMLALASGPNLENAIKEAVLLARRYNAELCGIAIIDVPRLSNVGPVPIGAGWHAQMMRDRRIRLARAAAAKAIGRFESFASCSGLTWSVRLEEGRPARLLAAMAGPQCLLAVTAGAWFDQGVLGLEVDTRRRLRWSGLRRDIAVLGSPTGKVAA
jgi:monovalent cation/proton antiporter MnhG/PhaG subunit